MTETGGENVDQIEAAATDPKEEPTIDDNYLQEQINKALEENNKTLEENLGDNLRSLESDKDFLDIKPKE